MKVEDLRAGDVILVPKRSSYREEAGDYMVNRVVHGVDVDGDTVRVGISDGRWIRDWFYPVGAEIVKVEA